MQKKPAFDQAMTDLAKAEIPGFEILWKADSRLQRILGALLFFVPAYMQNYTTVMFGKMYLPEVAKTPDFNLGETLAHEFVHLTDAKNDKLFNLKYLFPQILALGAFGAFWNLWFLLFLIALAPWPAYWRMKYELRGYTAQLALAHWAARWSDEIQDIAGWIPPHFTGGNYYWMWPFGSDVEKRVAARVKEVQSGEILKEAPYAEIKAALDKSPK